VSSVALIGGIASQPRYWCLLAATTISMVLLPVVVAAGMVWLRAGRLDPSVFVAWEELRAAVRDPFHNPVLDANIVYISFIKGAMDGQLYLYTVRSLCLSMTIGLLLGLNLAAWRVIGSLPATCAARLPRWGRFTGGGGGGMGVVLGAVAGAAGCCGFGVAGGGVLVAFGLSYTTATAFGAQSTALQMGAAVILAVNGWWAAQTYSRARSLT